VNSGIRRVGAAMIVLFVGLVAQLTYLQVARSDKLAADPRNSRTFLRNASRDRGPIVTSDGVIVARSVPANDEFKRQRVYPKDTATLFSGIVGYQSIQFGEVGVERTFSDDLAGRTFNLTPRGLADAFATRQPIGTVVLTASRAVQQVAANGLAGRPGSVVVLDVRTGGVLAAYSNPTYDPNLLVSHNPNKAQAARSLLLLDKSKPLLPHAWAELYPPGSTFKTVTASIAIQNKVDVDRQFPVLSEIPLPQTNGQTLSNFGGERCGGSLLDGFIVSCNTTFAQVGFDLGEQLASGVQRFGVQADPPPSGHATGFDPPIVRSQGPKPGTFQRNQPAFMQDAIGQHDVLVTPLQMALVAESVATGGTILDPHVVDCVMDTDNRVVKRVDTSEYTHAMDPTTADTMRQFMLGVVNDPRGTGTAAQIPGVQVAGKTGTAETGDGRPPHAWFIAFAPADAPRYAVAVLVEHGGVDGTNAEATGGRVAAPIAKQVLQSLLASPPPASQCGRGQPQNDGNGG
jgi:peptidoglycan glycosyltransferase